MVEQEQQEQAVKAPGGALAKNHPSCCVLVSDHPSGQVRSSAVLSNCIVESPQWSQGICGRLTGQIQYEEAGARSWRSDLGRQGSWWIAVHGPIIHAAEPFAPHMASCDLRDCGDTFEDIERFAGQPVQPSQFDDGSPSFWFAMMARVAIASGEWTISCRRAEAAGSARYSSTKGEKIKQARLKWEKRNLELPSLLETRQLWPLTRTELCSPISIETEVDPSLRCSKSRLADGMLSSLQGRCVRELPCRKQVAPFLPAK
ncbi:hypothetical protein CONLIGDRAFT_649271 [Coniochaeta ligniaria NRRL 30616]|uniref:Uncharacterized protein n=1 Tax=Coniochaeta ligniaria NRRL 30616 TaxID=1408157 RepID=A0A1J7I917_9PEZI|nr:hypothetical protein CONLIGDRAFT_649271 [Coniochaeta ligniaria NRRL 30616]